MTRDEWIEGSRRLPSGVTLDELMSLHTGDAIKAVVRTLQEQRQAGNLAVESLFILAMQPQLDGSMRGVTISLADGQRRQNLEAAVERHFGMRK